MGLAAFFCKGVRMSGGGGGSGRDEVFIRMSGGSGSGRDEVFIATVPLRAMKGPPQFLMSTAYSLNLWNFHHFMVIIKPASSLHQALVYDFQPQDPENILVALAALSGRNVSGIIRARKIAKVPKRKCWFVGYSKVNGTDAAVQFNETWETKLRIGTHDCRNYSQGLVEYLTGEKIVLEHLTEI